MIHFHRKNPAQTKDLGFYNVKGSQARGHDAGCPLPRPSPASVSVHPALAAHQALTHLLCPKSYRFVFYQNYYLNCIYWILLIFTVDLNYSQIFYFPDYKHKKTLQYTDFSTNRRAVSTSDGTLEDCVDFGSEVAYFKSQGTYYWACIHSKGSL